MGETDKFENGRYTTPSQEDLQNWVSRFGLNHPVVTDTNFGVTYRYPDPNASQIGLPSMTLLAPGMEVVIGDSFIRDSDIEALLPN